MKQGDFVHPRRQQQVRVLGHEGEGMLIVCLDQKAEHIALREACKRLAAENVWSPVQTDRKA
jgi:hypothetical protein